jgi:hypothetical protein
MSIPLNLTPQQWPNVTPIFPARPDANDQPYYTNFSPLQIQRMIEACKKESQAKVRQRT